MPEMEKDIAIEVQGLSKCFTRVGTTDGDSPELWALRDVSFTVKRGDSVGVFGHNGSGKSTLLKILAGVTKPTSGTVSVRGRIASILEIGAGFHPELSGRKNIYINGNILGFTKKEIAEHEEEIIEFSGIRDFIDEPVKNYSNGMYLRLAFSIMAHLDFDVYLFDEVLSVGDAQFSLSARIKFLDLSRRGKTFVVVSHSTTELSAQRRLLQLQDGHIVRSAMDIDSLSSYLEAAHAAQRIIVHTKAFTLTDIQQTSFESNPIVILQEVSLAQPSNNDEFRTDRPTYLTFLFEKISDDCTVDVVMSLQNLEGHFVLTSSPFLSGAYSTSVKKGTYKTQCIIPAAVLTAKAHTVNVFFIKNLKGWIDSEANVEPPAVSQICTNLLAFKANLRFMEREIVLPASVLPQEGLLINCEWRSEIVRDSA